MKIDNKFNYTEGKILIT